MSDTVEQARRLVRQAFRREWDGRWPPAQKHEEDALDAYAAAVRADERAKALDAVEQAMRTKFSRPQLGHLLTMSRVGAVLRELRGEVPHE